MVDDKEEKEMVHAKLEASELEKSGDVKPDEWFTVRYSDPEKKNKQIAQMNASAVLLARWQFLRFANKPSKESTQIQSMLTELNESGHIDLVPKINKKVTEDLGVWKNVSVSGAVSVSGGIDDVATGIGKIEADALIYPLERRLNSVNAVRFCVFGEFGLGWVSENAEVRFHEWLEKFPKIWAHLHFETIHVYPWKVPKN